jgi:hypothetical protein
VRVQIAGIRQGRRQRLLAAGKQQDVLQLLARRFPIRLSSAERVGFSFFYGLSEHLVMPFEALDVIG